MVKRMSAGGAVETQPDPNDSDQWQQIKQWVGASEDDKKRRPAGVVQMEDGGVVPDAPFDVNAGDSETIKLRGAPPTVSPDIAATPPPAPEAPPALPAIVPPASAPVAPTQPPQTAPDASYEAEADKILGTNPEARKALFQHLQKANMWSQIPAVLAGFGDSIARGFGRDKEANHMGELERSLGEQDKSRLENENEAAKIGKDRYALTHELQSTDSKSPYSRMVQNAYRQTLKAMGATDDDVNGMPADVISDVAQKKVTLEDALAKTKEEATYHRGMLENSASERRSKAGEEYAKLGVTGRLLTPKPVLKALEREALSLPGESVKEPPNGKTTVYQNGHIYQWNSTKGKYE